MRRIGLAVISGLSAAGPNNDYALLIKMYEGDGGKDGTAERRYGPAVCTGSGEQTITSHAQ
jgi:hypothetical protein